MNKAKEKALATYPVSMTFNSKGTGTYDKNFPRRKAYREGYEQAEQDMIEKACKWLKENANKYIVNVGEHGQNEFIVGGKCWENFRKYMEEQE